MKNFTIVFTITLGIFGCMTLELPRTSDVKSEAGSPSPSSRARLQARSIALPVHPPREVIAARTVCHTADRFLCISDNPQIRQSAFSRPQSAFRFSNRF